MMRLKSQRQQEPEEVGDNPAPATANKNAFAAIDNSISGAQQPKEGLEPSYNEHSQDHQ